MKVRIGFGLGTHAGLDAEGFTSLVDGLERRGFDSLWLSERVTGPAPDPVVGLAFAAARTTHLKLGTSVMVLPGRRPALVAKTLASLDRLSNARVLPAFGLGIADAAEQQAFGVERAERGAWFDEALPLIRRLWAGEVVDHDGPRFPAHGLRVQPTPVQPAMDVWLGGRSPRELRRVGVLADGWLPSFCTPDDAASGRKLVEEAAAGAGRRIDPEHYGALIIYTRDEIPDRLVAALAARRPDVAVDQVVAIGAAALREKVERFVEVGTSKFVLVPAINPEPAHHWDRELDELAADVLALQDDHRAT